MWALPPGVRRSQYRQLKSAWVVRMVFSAQQGGGGQQREYGRPAWSRNTSAPSRRQRQYDRPREEYSRSRRESPPPVFEEGGGNDRRAPRKDFPAFDSSQTRERQWRGRGSESSFASRDRDGDSFYSKSRNTPGSNLPQLRDSWNGDVVYGISPVLAALESGRRTVHALYVQEGLDDTKRKDKGVLSTAIAKARELGAEIVYKSKHDLNMVCDNRPHQGLVLDASPLDFENLDAVPWAKDVWGEGISTGHGDARPQSPPIWLCLDEVMDPQNFGAALRSAFFLGASAVLTCRRNSAPLSGVVSKASAGAMEAAPVFSCRSLPATLADARTRGWTIVGAAATPEAVPCSKFTPDGPTILVMGNEGHGLRTTVRQLCDVMLRIEGGPNDDVPMLGLGQGLGGAVRQKHARSLVDSLNVSVATGILLHQLVCSPCGSSSDV